MTSSNCFMNCPIFQINCRHRIYEIDYLTLPQLIFLSKILFEYKLDDKDFWYQIITGKSLKDIYYKNQRDKELTAKLKSEGLDFPDNAPYITKEEINEIMQAQKQGIVNVNDPEYWDEERIEFSQSKEAWKRKLALSDWFWDWYKKLKKKGLEHLLSRELLIKKKELDELIYSVVYIDNEPLFTNEKAIIDKSKLDKEKEVKLNELLGEVVEAGYIIEFKDQNNRK